MKEKLVRPKVNKLLTITAVIIFIMILNAIYLVYEFYTLDEDAACAINEFFNCITVAKTEYAVLFGLPIALWGAVFYAGLLFGTIGVVLNIPFWKIHKKLRPQTVLNILRYFSYFGLLFSLYLTYIEAFVIYVFCPLCLIQQVGIIAIVGLYLYINKIISDGKKETRVCEFC